MIREAFIFLLVFTGYLSFGQLSKESWHDGFLVTVEQDTLTGQINYDMETNMVQIASGKSVKAYSAYKAFYFEIFDNVYHSYRQFYTIPYNLKGNYETPVIFELLYEGGVSLLAREKVVQETVTSSNPFWSAGPRMVQNSVDYNFFFLDKKGNITYFGGSKNDLLQIMQSKRDKVKDFIRSNRLQTNELKDLIRITSFYNSI